MNKRDLIEAVAKETKDSRAGAERAVKAVLESIKKGIKKDKTVQLIGFGTFSIRKRKARMGINPATGEKMKYKASKTVGFKPGKAFKGAI